MRLRILRKSDKDLKTNYKIMYFAGIWWLLTFGLAGFSAIYVWPHRNALIYLFAAIMSIIIVVWCDLAGMNYKNQLEIRRAGALVRGNIDNLVERSEKVEYAITLLSRVIKENGKKKY